MPIGDLLFSLMGQSNPRDQLVQALGPTSGRGSMLDLINAANKTSSAAPLSQPAVGQDLQASQPQPQPQPQAYTSPPDMTKLYLSLMDRASANAAIDRGFGMMAAGLSGNQADRATMVGAMSPAGGGVGGTGTIGDQLADLLNLRQASQQQALMSQSLASLPSLAKQLKMPIEQVQAAYASGALPDILKAAYTTSTPLSHAQVTEAVARAAEAQANTVKANAEVSGTIPDDQMKELNSLNAARKTQGLPPLDILSYKMFAQPLDPAMRTYYMQHPEMMPSGAGTSGVSPGSPGAPGTTVGSGPPPGTPAGSGPTAAAFALVTFEDAKKSNFNNIPPSMPSPAAVQPIRGESFQQWQARQAQAFSFNEAATKAAAQDQQESISALKDGSIDDIGVKVQHLQSLLGSPLLPYAVGKFYGRLPDWVRPQDMEDFKVQLRQAQEAVYQTATTKLKSVTIRATQQEIGRVADALGKLDATQQSPDAYKQAIGENLNDLASVAFRTTQNAGVAPPNWLRDFKPTQPAPVTAVKPGLAPSSSGQSNSLKPMSDADRAKAQTLIERDGRNKVIQYLKANGYDTGGL